MKARSLRRRITCVGVALLAIDGLETFAQEALGEAMITERSQRTRKEAFDKDLYNLRAGPLFMRFDAIMGFEINDNPQLVEDPNQIDFGFRPQVNIGTTWPINPNNSLSLNLGLGYVKYVHNSDLDHVIIAPSSELAFDIRTGDVTINFHDRIGYSQDPLNDPTVSGTGDFGGIDNTIGVRVDWDLNRLLLSGGYDHVNFFSTGSALSDVQERSQELFYARVGAELSPYVRAGIELGAGLTDYTGGVFADNTEFSAGPYVEFDVTKEIKLRAAGGYVRYDFDDVSATGTNVARVPDSVSDFYASIGAEQQLSRFMSHHIALGREARAGAASELVTMWYVRYGNDWNVSQHTTLHTQLFYENGRERAGLSSERFWRVGAGAGVSIPLSRQLTATAAYQLIHKDSDQPQRDYLQNVLVINFKYVF